MVAAHCGDALVVARVLGGLSERHALRVGKALPVTISEVSLWFSPGPCDVFCRARYRVTNALGFGSGRRSRPSSWTAGPAPSGPELLGSCSHYNQALTSGITTGSWARHATWIPCRSPARTRSRPSVGCGPDPVTSAGSTGTAAACGDSGRPTLSATYTPRHADRSGPRARIPCSYMAFCAPIPSAFDRFSSLVTRRDRDDR